ncbi:aromatic-ring hydroxylase C-terminal domain-containing protein [Castellaniella caeni]
MVYADSVLNTPDDAAWPENSTAPGEILPPAYVSGPRGKEPLYKAFDDDFVVLYFGSVPEPGWLRDAQIHQEIHLVRVGADSPLAKAMGARENAAFLVRPDMYVCARWLVPAPGKLVRALRRAHGQNEGDQ